MTKATASKSQLAYEHLRERITRGGYGPGTGWCSTSSPASWG
jgi:DNA-binding GntR family transcriptional regulator